jgi:hypothetical protein
MLEVALRSTDLSEPYPLMDRSGAPRSVSCPLMLSSLSCRNFRSLQAVDVPLAPLTALVGPNGAGKSAVLRAIDLAAGPVWPSLQRLRFPHDFFGYDESLELLIGIGLS